MQWCPKGLFILALDPKMTWVFGVVLVVCLLQGMSFEYEELIRLTVTMRTLAYHNNKCRDDTKVRKQKVSRRLLYVILCHYN